eukprot:SAG22_NODE_4266_length_1323_cov_3.314542_1_plen_96_part_00
MYGNSGPLQSDAALPDVDSGRYGNAGDEDDDDDDEDEDYYYLTDKDKFAGSEQLDEAEEFAEREITQEELDGALSASWNRKERQRNTKKGSDHCL